jgi:hypothetical protein
MVMASALLFQKKRGSGDRVQTIESNVLFRTSHIFKPVSCPLAGSSEACHAVALTWNFSPADTHLKHSCFGIHRHRILMDLKWLNLP